MQAAAATATAKKAPMSTKLAKVGPQSRHRTNIAPHSSSPPSVCQTDCETVTERLTVILQGVSCLYCAIQISSSPPFLLSLEQGPNMLPEKRGLATFRKLNVPPLCGTHYKSEGFMASSRCRSVLKTAFMTGSDFPGSRKGSTRCMREFNGICMLLCRTQVPFSLASPSACTLRPSAPLVANAQLCYCTLCLRKGL